MKKEKKELGWIVRLLLIAAIVCAFVFSLSRLDRGSSEIQRRQLEDSIRRACISCYSIEGIYPPTLSYLQENYGLQLNDKHYTVFYEAFAENIMPEITVVMKQP